MMLNARLRRPRGVESHLRHGGPRGTYPDHRRPLGLGPRRYPDATPSTPAPWAGGVVSSVTVPGLKRGTASALPAVRSALSTSRNPQTAAQDASPEPRTPPSAEAAGAAQGRALALGRWGGGNGVKESQRFLETNPGFDPGSWQSFGSLGISCVAGEPFVSRTGP